MTKHYGVELGRGSSAPRAAGFVSKAVASSR